MCQHAKIHSACFSYCRRQGAPKPCGLAAKGHTASFRGGTHRQMYVIYRPRESAISFRGIFSKGLVYFRYLIHTVIFRTWDHNTRNCWGPSSICGSACTRGPTFAVLLVHRRMIGRGARSQALDFGTVLSCWRGDRMPGSCICHVALPPDQRVSQKSNGKCSREGGYSLHTRPHHRVHRNGSKAKWLAHKAQSKGTVYQGPFEPYLLLLCMWVRPPIN